MPPDRVLFGAAYYNEYQRDDRLENDLDLMVKANFSVIRVGESVWSTWEPENGHFDLDWLAPVLDRAHERGISVILGTPTYAVPPWLARLYPEIAGQRQTGERIPWGSRQEVDFTHPAFRFHAERVVRRILSRYAQHRAVIGFQVDNEPGNELLHNPGVFQRFVDYLRLTYGDVETLNTEWGLVYWSHRLSTWADLWTPDGNSQPQYDVAWRRFQAEQTNQFIKWQADLVREYASADQIVTTCLAYERPAMADDELTSHLDVTAGNAYYEMQDALEVPGRHESDQTWTSSGTWALYLSADRMFSSRQEQFLVMETNASHIGHPWNSQPAYDGQWRQTAWALVSRGARMVEYWHWHSLHFGAETYWGGVLPHSGIPGRTYAELSQVGHDFKRAGSLIADLMPESDIAMVFSMPSKWLMQKFPFLTKDDGAPDDRAYHGFFDPLYRGAFEAGLQVRILHASQLSASRTDGPGLPPDEAAEKHPVLVAPALYVASDETLDWLVDYAVAGGHLVLMPRTGCGDHEARARHDVAPARMAAAAGVWYDEFSNLRDAISVRPGSDGNFQLSSGAAGTRWIDGIVVEDAEVLAHYDHPHFGRWPALTSRHHGQGRITCLGTIPNEELAGDIARWLVPRPKHGMPDLPSSVRATTAITADSRRLHFLHNWSWNPVTITTGADLVDVLSGEPMAGDKPVDLGPWDVRVLIERPDLP